MQIHLGKRKGENLSLAGTQGFGKMPFNKAMGACKER